MALFRQFVPVLCLVAVSLVSSRILSAADTACWKPRDASDSALIRLQDFCIFRHDGYTYCASMKKDLCNQGIIVARSRDLKEWETLGDAVSTRTPEDSSMVWAPHVVEHKDTFYMFYTGVTQPGPGQWCQRILVASAKDPSKPASWQRDYKARFMVDGREESWFRPSHPGTVWTDKAWADCRDPMVLKEGQTWYMFYSGTDTTGGITGVATAPDILGPWTDRGAVMRVSSGIPESCFIVKTPDKNSFLMVFNHAGNMPERGIKTARSTSGLLPLEGKPCFTDIRLFQDKETQSGLNGWAHEFIPGRKGHLLSAYLTGYWVNLEESVLVKESFGWTINPAK